MEIDRRKLVSVIGAWKPFFVDLSSKTPYERKGILFSEMFFLRLCTDQCQPKRILESGRARGQSTLMLAKMFPDIPIISIEHDPNSPDVQVAANRLAGLNHVDMRFGDAVKILPEIIEFGDVVLIDGPKGFRGLRLALRLLATKKSLMIFVHDVGAHTPERAFLERYLPSCVYSDAPDFVALAYDLDSFIKHTLPPEHRIGGIGSYGYGLVCLPYTAGEWYGMLCWRAAVATFLDRLRTLFGFGNSA